MPVVWRGRNEIGGRRPAVSIPLHATLTMGILALLASPSRGLVIVDNDGNRFQFNHASATFGEQLPYNVSGSLVFVKDSFSSNPRACTPFALGVLSNKIVLVEQGDCPFANKALNVQKAGAKGIIVGSTDTNGKLQRMSCDTNFCSNITLPAIYIEEQTVVSIHEAYTPITAYLNATGNVDPSSPNNTQRLTFFLVVLLIIPIAWCIMVAITLVFKICSRLANRQIRRQEMRQLPDIPYTLIEANDEDEEKGKDIKTNNRSSPINDTCVICLEEFSPGQQIKILPCRHGFHGDCIDPWLSERSDQCPICKRSVLVDPDRRICFCIPLERCRACCAGNNGNLSPRVTQMIMLLVVAFLAIIVALFFLYP